MKALWDKIGPLGLPLAFIVLLGWYWPQLPQPRLIFVVFGFITSVMLYFASVLILNPKGVHPSIKSWAPTVTALIVVAIAALMILAFTTTFWGTPLDLRFFLSPAYVARAPVPDEPIGLMPAWGNEVLKPKYAGPGSGELSKVLEQMDIWKKWVKEGASSHTPTDKLVVYRSAPMSDFIESYNGKLSFPDLENARLAEGVAFLIGVDANTGRNTWRPLELRIDEQNMDRPEHTLENTLSGIEIDAGNVLFAILEFVSSNTEALPSNLDKWKAVVERQDQSPSEENAQ